MSNHHQIKGKRPDMKTYCRVYQQLIKQALFSDITATLIACNKSDEDQVIGWVNFGDDYVNYVFVKELFEDMGVSSALLAQTGVDPNKFVVTHYTRMFHEKHSKKLNIIYNPYIFTHKEFYEDKVSQVLDGREMRQRIN